MPELNIPEFSAAAGELKTSMVAVSAAHGGAADLVDPDNVMMAPRFAFPFATYTKRQGETSSE
jgi:hypothetical protein